MMAMMMIAVMRNRQDGRTTEPKEEKRRLAVSVEREDEEHKS